MSGPPHYCEAVVGFRAWRPREDGLLAPWTMVNAPWRPGVNEGRCLVSAQPSHAVPGHDCTCGLYALTSADDPRLDATAAVVGSIAGWGEIEVHATGFRARYAAVTALAVSPRASPAHRALLAAAAQRYDVPLVADADLARHAQRFGRPVAFESILQPPPAPIPRGPRLDEHGRRGIAVDDHVWVEIVPGGMLALGITAAIASEIAICSTVRTAAPGSPSRRSGGTLATIGAGADALLARSPFDLAVVEPNPLLATDPDLVRTDPEGEGWLLRALPLDWDAQSGDILWGRHADTIYRASVAHAARLEDPFGWQKPAWVANQPRARCAADALAILAADRGRPRFADARAVEEQIGGRVARALEDPAVRASAFRAGVRLELRLHEPDAGLGIDLGAAPQPRAHTTPTAQTAGTTPTDRTTPTNPTAQSTPTAGTAAHRHHPPAEATAITLDTDAETADLFLAGRLDIASALRSQRIRTDTRHTRVLVVASLIKELQRAYRAQGAMQPGPARR